MQINPLTVLFATWLRAAWAGVGIAIAMRDGLGLVLSLLAVVIFTTGMMMALP